MNEMTNSETRDIILDVTEKLIYRHGIAATGMDFLVKTAGVSRKSIYRYFANKDELVIAALQRRDERWMHWLRSEVERLRVFENKFLDMQMRVRRFEEMLSFDKSSEISNNRIIARSVNESKGLFVHSALINAGKNKGVKPGYAVMTTDGLYGHVLRSGAVSARVLLLNDINSRISVMDQRSQSRAILVGTNTKHPKLEYVALSADWQIGDRVITSGDGGVLPRGLQIGTVVEAKSGGYAVELFYLQKPVDLVWVYPFTRIANPDLEDAENEAKSSVNNENSRVEDTAQPTLSDPGTSQ